MRIKLPINKYDLFYFFMLKCFFFFLFLFLIILSLVLININQIIYLFTLNLKYNKLIIMSNSSN